MFTLSGLILETRENLFQDFWSPFSIFLIFFPSVIIFLKKERNRQWAVLGQDSPGRGLYKPGQASPKASRPETLGPAAASPAAAASRRRRPAVLPSLA